MRDRIFGLPQGTPLDRNAKVRVMANARAYNSRHRTRHNHIGPLTRATLDVLRALLWGFHNGARGDCFPSLERIAERAGCNRDTVAVAIKALEAARLLTWCHRIRRVAVMAGRELVGWRILRTSNAYLFTLPGNLPDLTKSQRQLTKSENPTGTPAKESLPLSDRLAAALERLGKAVRGSGREG